jgi:protein-tyrosine phosphatase
MDDGPRDVETALKIINLLKRQGIEKIYATPHYYLYKETIQSFLSRRSESYALISDPESAQLPKIQLGAEVHLERGLDELNNISELCIDDTKYILFELPSSQFKPWMIETIRNITYKFSIIPVIAHFERYINLYSKNDLFEFTSFDEIVYQFNYDALYISEAVNLIQKLLNSNKSVVFGSDSHNITDRAPRFDTAMQMLTKKFKVYMQMQK